MAFISLLSRHLLKDVGGSVSKHKSQIKQKRDWTPTPGVTSLLNAPQQKAAVCSGALALVFNRNSTLDLRNGYC